MLHLFYLTVDTEMNVVTNVTVVQCSTVDALVSDLLGNSKKWS